MHASLNGNGGSIIEGISVGDTVRVMALALVLRVGTGLRAEELAADVFEAPVLVAVALTVPRPVAVDVVDAWLVALPLGTELVEVELSGVLVSSPFQAIRTGRH